MDFRLSPEQLELKESARRFARDKLPAVAEQCENSITPPSREPIREYADMGFLGINVPAELGGRGLGNLEAARLLITVCRATPMMDCQAFLILRLPNVMPTKSRALARAMRSR